MRNALQHMADRLRLPVMTIVLITGNMVLAFANLALFVWGAHRWYSLAVALFSIACSVTIYFFGRKTWGYRQEAKFWEDRLAEIKTRGNL